MNAVITGGTKGIGLAIAQKLAAKGYNLWLCARNEVDLYTCLGELQTMHPGKTFRAMPADMSKKEDVMAFGDWILKRRQADRCIGQQCRKFLTWKYFRRGRRRI